jgi:signal transduction histidine kinase
MVHDETSRLPYGLGNTGIVSFAQDQKGTIWIGLAHSGGLLRLRGGRFETFATMHGDINKLLFDSHGRLWAASSQSGLGLVANPNSSATEFEHYTRVQGLSSDEVWCLTEDRLGRIYAGTAQGVDRLDPATRRIVHYSAADGLVRGDIRSAIRDRHGGLWFASANGVSRFTPSEDRITPSPRTRITGIRAGGVPYPISEFGATELANRKFLSHQNSLQIDFAATDYYAATPLHYQFRLDGGGRNEQTNAWQDAGTTASMYLVDLPPGNHFLAVRALTPEGLSGDSASFSFTILQPFWRTWWFQLACASVIAALAYWVHTQRLRQQIAVERVRSRIAMDLHDDIGASLSRISVIGEALKSHMPTGDEEVESMLDDIAASSRHVIAEMGDIVWSLNPRRDQIGEIATRLRAFGSDLLEKRGVEWAVDAPTDAVHQSVPPILRRQLYLILKEGIHNVAKHSHAQKASLRLWLENGDVRGELIDDGCGIEGGAHHGTGIQSMTSRAKQLGGTLDITAGMGGGTSIRVSLPLSNHA